MPKGKLPTGGVVAITVLVTVSITNTSPLNPLT